MLVNEYFKYALSKRYFAKINWYYTCFTIPTGSVNEYFKITDNNYYVLVNDEYKQITDLLAPNPLLVMSNPITVSDIDIENIDNGEVETTIGRAIINKVLLSDVFGKKIPYMNKRIYINDIENTIASGMYYNELIKVSEYQEFVDRTSFIQTLSRITTISNTEKSIQPPPGIKEYKATVKAEFNKKYGVNWVKDRSRIVEYETKLKEFDAKWMAGDATQGFITSGKILDKSRTRMYLGFGAEEGFDKSGKNVQLIEGSLLDGYPEDKDKLVTMFNTARAGSYDRGVETQKGGAAAKDILRATSTTKILPGDCGSKVGKTVLVTDNIATSMTGRVILTNGGLEIIKNGKDYIGKTVKMRSPLYCLQKGNNLCSVCVGDVMKKYDKGISLLVTDISSKLLAASMKATHGKVLSAVEFNLTENIT